MLDIAASKKIFVTGGAGFIGSHLIERLCELECEVTVYDNLSTGKLKWIQNLPNKYVNFIQADLQNTAVLNQVIRDHDIVIHFAAYADTQRSEFDRDSNIQNILNTKNLLEAMQNHKIKHIVFASSQLVYGELQKFPVSEEAGPLLPISLYGASKLACEGILSAYAHLFDIQTTICRFANIMGGRMWRGILYDFIRKLLISPERLEILGDGQQSRNYLLVDHCIDALLLAMTHNDSLCSIFNIGNTDTITATNVASIVIEEMGLDKITTISYAGGTRGWRCDVPNMQYDISKMQAMGWSPRLGSSGCIRESTRRLQKDLASDFIKKNELPSHNLNS